MSNVSNESKRKSQTIANASSNQMGSKSKLPLQYNAPEMKRKLITQLEKEKSEKYFELLGKMLCGDLPKVDFDKQIKLMLNEEQRKLHNLFVISVLRSAYGSIATSNVQRRSIKAAPLVPKLGPGTRDINRQPIWSRIRTKMVHNASLSGLTVDSEAINAVMLGLEHHIKSILSIAQPTRRVQQRIMVSPIIEDLAKLENREVLRVSKKCDITVNNVTSALAIIPNCFTKIPFRIYDDFNFYHTQNHFAHAHIINANLEIKSTQILKKRKFQEFQQNQQDFESFSQQQHLSQNNQQLDQEVYQHFLTDEKQKQQRQFSPKTNGSKSTSFKSTKINSKLEKS